MRRILITQKLFLDHNEELHEALNPRWADLLGSLDMLAVPFPVFSDPLKFIQEFGISGVILSGGNDLPKMKDSEPNRLRDQAERKLLDVCRSRSLPVLGVCRGMQLIGDAFGLQLEAVKGHVRTFHKLQFRVDSYFSRCFGRDIEVNSFHNFGFTRASPDFEVWARSAEGVIEGFRHTSCKLTGIMWHPERVWPFSEPDKNLLCTCFDKDIN